MEVEERRRGKGQIGGAIDRECGGKRKRSRVMGSGICQYMSDTILMCKTNLWNRCGGGRGRGGKDFGSSAARKKQIKIFTKTWKTKKLQKT